MQAFGRPSPAAAIEPPLRTAADAASASYRAESGTTGWCSLAAATIAGVGHRLAGEGNQDCYGWAVGNGRLVVAIADGLGSVPGSGDAAGAVVAAAVSSAGAAGTSAGEAATAAVRAAAAELRSRGSGSGASTLAVCVLEPGGHAAFARIGDSTAFVVEGEAEPRWREVFDPPADHEDEMPVVTAALTGGEEGPPADIEEAEVTLDGSEFVVVVTDGIAGPWRDGPTTVAPAMVDGLLGRPSALGLAGLADFSRQGCHDDRTIVAVWPAGVWVDYTGGQGEEPLTGRPGRGEAAP